MNVGEIFKSNITVMIGLIFTAGGLYYKVDGIDDREENMEVQMIKLKEDQAKHVKDFTEFKFEYIRENERLKGENKLLKHLIEDIKTGH